MTDANLMDADCIHGVTWWECPDCPIPTPKFVFQAGTLDREGDTWVSDQAAAEAHARVLAREQKSVPIVAVGECDNNQGSIDPNSVTLLKLYDPGTPEEGT